ncbi:YadA-like family protein [Pasteurellaceae bacterium 22721_9_1]
MYKKHNNTAKTAITLLTALATGQIFATPISIQGTATSENAVSIGTDSFATALDGVATGKGSVATGNGFNREDFANKVNAQNALLSEKATKQEELDTINTNLEANDKTQDNLNKQIADLTNLIDSKEQKSDQLDNLNDELANKGNELTGLTQDLDNAKNSLPNEYLIGENKNVAVDFTPVLNSLDYNKLNNADGRSELTQDLKNKLEGDFPDIQGMFTDKQYLDVLNEFINKRSSYDAYRNIYDAEMGNEKYRNISVGSDNTSVPLNTGLALENIYLRLGKSIQDISRDDIYTHLENDEYNHTNSTYQDNNNLSNKNLTQNDWDKARNFKHSDLQRNLYDQLILSHLIADTSTNTHAIATQYTNVQYFNRERNASNGHDKDYVFKLAPLKGNYDQSNPFQIIKKAVKSEIAPSKKQTGLMVYVSGVDAVVERIIKDKALSDEDLEYIKHRYDQFNLYSDTIDYDSDKWVVDKDHYRENLQKVLDFNAKLEEYRQVSEQIRNDAVTNNVRDELLARQINLKKEIEALNVDSSYFERMSVRFNETGKNEVNQGIDYVIKQENFIDKNLRYYDGKNVIITKVQEKIKEIQSDISQAQQAVDRKQREIDELNKQITDLALTPDEQGAADLKAEKERELADKQAEKAQLEDDKARKQNELDEINRQLADSSLRDLGLRSQAHGSNAFASGNDSIAMGTNSTVTANDGIVIGRDSMVTGLGSVAIGTNNQVQSANAVVLGNNITVGSGFDNAVVLGNSSTVEAPNPTENIVIRGVTHNFAGIQPTSTVSVGAEGAERQIVNVAAGRVSSTSTDAINGSQLYAVVDAVNRLELGAVNPDDVSDAINNAIANNIKAGDNVTIDETTDPDSGAKTFTINAIVPKSPLTTVSTGAGLALTTTTTTNDEGVSVTDYHIVATGNDNQEVVEESVSAGSENLTVKQEGVNESGGKNFVVDLNKNLDLTDKGSVKLGDVLLSSDQLNMGGHTITNVGVPVNDNDVVNKAYVDNGKPTVTSKDATVSITETVVNATTGAINYDLSVTGGLHVETDDGTSTQHKLGDTIFVTGDGKNISTATVGGKVQVKLADDVKVNSITAGNVSLSTKGVNAGGKKVTNVAPATISPTSTEAVNGSQLFATNLHVHQNTQNIAKLGDRVNHLDHKINRVNKDLRAGVAGSAAIAGLPQVRGNGKSMVSASAGNYKGQSAIAVGYSRASDNGKLLLKLSGSANTQGDIVSSVGIGYEW